MPAQDNKQTIKITLDDLKNLPAEPQAANPVAAPDAQAPGTAKVYGNVANTGEDAPISSQGRGSIVLQAWFYLGLAGVCGALAGWGIAEPGFVDGAGRGRWGNFLLLPSMIALLCVGFGIAESIVERSFKKAAYRTALSLPLGVIFGFFFDFTANIVYNMGLGFAAALGVRSYHNPITWLARGLGWVVFGVAGGLVY